MCWQDSLWLLSFSSLSVLLEMCPVQQLPLAVWLKMIGFIPWWEFSVGQVLPWDPFRLKISLYTHFESSCGSSLTTSVR